MIFLRAKEKKGITLIALVITIIVLLILAGVTIAALSGDNGILQNATKAKEETEIGNEKDQIGIAIAGTIADNKGENITEEGLKTNLINRQGNDADVTEEDEYFRIRFNDSQREYLINKITGEIEGGDTVELPEILKELKVGSEVTYNPNGIYTWKAKFYSSTKTVDKDDVLLESGTGKNYNINKWRVLEIDKVTGKVTLVPVQETIGVVYLSEAQGYNNGVYLLNEACSELYGNEEKGIKARSINLEDIENRMTDEALNGENGAHNIDVTSYKKQVENKYTSSKSYPIIYENENLSVINEHENNDINAFGMSEQERLIQRTENKATEGYITTATTIQPYNTYWYKDKEFKKNAFKTSDNGINYSELLIPHMGSTTYWIASRCILTYPYDCAYGIRYMSAGDIHYCSMFFSTNNTNGAGLGLFPIVSLDANLIEKDDTSGFIVK